MAQFHFLRLHVAAITMTLVACTTDTSGGGTSTGGTSTGGASTGGTSTGGTSTGGAESICEGEDYTEENCAGPTDAGCAETYEAQVQAACANVDGFEFTGEYGECGQFMVTRHGGFYNSIHCFYDPTSHMLVGAIACGDVANACGLSCTRTGDVAVCCAALPTPCPVM